MQYFHKQYRVVVQKRSLQSQIAWFQIMTYSVTLGKSFNFSVA